jgi:hypothetical protein
LLHNFAATDVTFQSRFATELVTNGYNPVNEESEYYELFQDVTNRFKLEVLDMTCDIESGLNAIAEALRYSGGGGCSSPSNPTFNCIVNLDNEQLLGPPDESQGNPEYDSPPEGFATWDEYFAYKCQAAHFIWDLYRKNMVMIRNFEGVALVSSIVAPVAAGVAGVLPAVFTPAGFVLFVGTIVAIGVVAGFSWFYIDEMIDEWDTNKADIVCALYNSGSSVQAVSALAGFVEDAIQAIVSWGALAPVAGEIASLLGTAFAQLTGNGMVEPLFKTVAAVTSIEETVDCDTCGQGYPYAQTQLFSPYNVMTQGDDVSAADDDSVLGFKGTNSATRFDLEFHVEGGYTGLWQWSAEYMPVEAPPQTCNVQLEAYDGMAWGQVTGGLWQFNITDTGWTTIGATGEDINFSDATQYRLHCQPQDFNESGWYRKVNLQPE